MNTDIQMSTDIHTVEQVSVGHLNIGDRVLLMHGVIGTVVYKGKRDSDGVVNRPWCVVTTQGGNDMAVDGGSGMSPISRIVPKPTEGPVEPERRTLTVEAVGVKELQIGDMLMIDRARIQRVIYRGESRGTGGSVQPYCLVRDSRNVDSMYKGHYGDPANNWRVIADSGTPPQ